jgi:hypothetical protein
MSKSKKSTSDNPLAGFNIDEIQSRYGDLMMKGMRNIEHDEETTYKKNKFITWWDTLRLLLKLQGITWPYILGAILTLIGSVILGILTLKWLFSLVAG